jgi:hypothetical protein
MRRHRLAFTAIAALSLLLAARGLQAQTLDKQLQTALERGDMDAALKLAAIDQSPADVRFFFLDMVRECAVDMTCTVALAPLSAKAPPDLEGAELPVPQTGWVVVTQKSKDGTGSGKMEMPYGTVGGKPVVIGARLTAAKIASLRATSNEKLMDEALAQGIYDSKLGERRTDWKKAATPLGAGGGEFGAFLVQRAAALQKAVAANDPDAAAAAGGGWAAMVFGATGYDEKPIPLPARKAKLRAQSMRFLRDIKVLGGYQLGDDAMLTVEAVDGAGWTARGPMLVSRNEEGFDVGGDLTIAYPK